MTGPPSRKMTINALNSQALAWMADFEDATVTELVQRRRRPAQPVRRTPRADRLHRRERQALRGGGRHPDRAGPPARLAPRGEAPHAGRAARARRIRRLRALLLPQRRNLDRGWCRSLLLSAQDGVLPRSQVVERRVPLRAGPTRDPVRHDPGHLPDRDHPGRLRDGGDPLRTARPLRRSQRGTLGLHLLDDQELRRRRRSSAARPEPGDDDLAVHGRVRGAAGQDLPRPGCPRDRRYGGLRAEQGQSGRHRCRAGEDHRRQVA